MVNKQSDLTKPERRIAMLIDSDNVQYSCLEDVYNEAKRYGNVIIRRAYGDWSEPYLANWKPALLENGIQPVQQLRYIASKNATDGRLIIDAMDLLHWGRVDGFCIVSSDSDFTSLCIRIREQGLFVMGAGRTQTNKAYVHACDTFFYTDAVQEKANGATALTSSPPVAMKKVEPVTAPVPAPVKTPKTPPLTPTQIKQNDPKLKNKALNLLRRGIELSIKDNEGWTGLSPLGTALHKLDTQFDSRTYGFQTLSLLIKSMPKHIEVKTVKKTGTSTIYARIRGA